MGEQSEQVLELLSGLRHPEAGESIVDLELVNLIECSEAALVLEIRKRAPNDPFGQSMVRAAQRLLAEHYPAARIEVRLAESGTTPRVQTPKRGGIENVHQIIAVGSGKGGVGKSTITVNLAVALARKGYSVGLLDADVFGPSMTIMLGVQDQQPTVQKEDGEDLIVPIEAYGVKMLSMGFFVSAHDALVWRGPMASSALKQLIHMGLWGELDYLLIDTPPGTSDIHLTLVQELALTGAVLITTPQHIAVADAEKMSSMFSGKDINVPVLGVVENMSWFEPAELPGHRYYLFGRDGGKEFAESHGVALLGQVPLVQSIREGGDVGCPIAAESSPLGNAFDELALNVVEQTQLRNATLPPTNRVQLD